MADFTKQIYADIPGDKQQLILLKSNISGYFFDAVLRSEHHSALKITTHPVQSGANVADHAYVEPATLTMELGMSDVMPGIIETQFTDQSSRSISAFQVLRKLQADRMPLQVTTRLHTYKNMMLEELTVPDDYKTQFGLRATVRFTEILVAKVSKVTVSSKPHITEKTNKGKQQPTDPPDTALKQALDAIGG
jgi:hypothetical protein